jgi:Ca2+-binding EF-hand superfamily protein
MIQEVDTESGTIDFEEFVQMMQVKLQEVDVQEEIIEAFRVFDKERTGFVSIDEVKKVLTKMGDGALTKDEVNEILRELDPEGL